MNRQTVMIIIIEILSALVAFIAYYMLMNVIGKVLKIYFSDFFLFHFGYIGMVTGISLTGYAYLKMSKKRKKITVRVIISLIGVLVGSYFYYLISLQLFGQVPFIYTAWILPIILPLIGAILGFHYRKYE